MTWVYARPGGWFPFEGGRQYNPKEDKGDYFVTEDETLSFVCPGGRVSAERMAMKVPNGDEGIQNAGDGSELGVHQPEQEGHKLVVVADEEKQEDAADTGAEPRRNTGAGADETKEETVSLNSSPPSSSNSSSIGDWRAGGEHAGAEREAVRMRPAVIPITAATITATAAAASAVGPPATEAAAVISTAAAAAAAATSATAADPVVEDTAHVPIAQWLTRINSVLGQYADHVRDYGYENSGMLEDAEADDFEEACEAANMKKPHRKKVMVEFKRFQLEISKRASSFPPTN
jgi:hypothetical protein